MEWFDGLALSLQAFAIAVLAYGAYLCIAHRDVLDESTQTIRTAGAGPGESGVAPLPVRGERARRLVGQIVATVICGLVVVVMLAACDAETPAAAHAAALEPAQSLPAPDLVLPPSSPPSVADSGRGDGEFKVYEYH